MMLDKTHRKHGQTTAMIIVGEDSDFWDHDDFSRTAWGAIKSVTIALLGKDLLKLKLGQLDLLYI